MAYTPDWEPLANALKRVMATGIDEDEAKTDLCCAVADRKIRVRVRVVKTDRLRGSKFFSNRNVGVPARLHPSDLDWMRSCPLNPWSIGPSGPESYTWLVGWHDHSLDLIELSTADVTEILCGKRTATGGHETSALVVSHSDIKKRKRGSPPKKFEETKRAMSDHLRQGQETVDGLRRMLEKELKLRYGVSRDTARKARNEVLSEFVENSKTTNDK